jgi:glycosyltransferase involved in cell wall biosynthesis
MIPDVTDAPARFAVVLTHNRPELLTRCVAAIAPQVDLVLVVDNASDPPVNLDDLHAVGGSDVLLLSVPGQPPNLARLWNLGFEVVRRAAGDADYGQWDIAVLCDDAIAPDGWVDTVATGMRAHGAAAAATHSIAPVAAPILKTAPDADIANRMPGWAFVLRGELGLRADESMHWWYQDTSLDFSARLAGGMVIVPGSVVVNELPNDFTSSVPGLAEQAARDREAFAAKWGEVPW